MIPRIIDQSVIRIEEGHLGTGFTDENGTAQIVLNSNASGILSEGQYKLYSIYPGQTRESATYLPIQSDDITLHVVDVYQIHYHLNGGIANPENPTMLTNESVPVELKAPAKKFYNFGGWFLDEALTEPLENNTLNPSGLTGDVNLYAKWSPTEYSIHYELNGGENSPDNPAVYTTEDTIILKDATRLGYHFDGWYRKRRIYRWTSEKNHQRRK